MNPKAIGYKWCVVPECENNTKHTPEKLFISVPRHKTMRKKWLTLARHDPTYYSLKSVIYFCEDHFDLPNDMVNFMEYHMMGSVSKVNMKPGCIPLKFECQPDRKGFYTTEQQHILTVKQRKLLVEQCLKDAENTTKDLELEETSSESLNLSTPLSPSLTSLQIENTSNCSDKIQKKKKQMPTTFMEHTLLKIEKNPHPYIGIPKNCYYLVNLIEDKTKIPVKDILLCLRKIRCNSSYKELGDNFSMTPSSVCKIFFKNIPVIASVMRSFITPLNKHSIKNSLPMAFRHKYYNVSCIINCLEIEIQRPSETLHQSLSWSEYKKGNTIKYLVSSTPNGLVNYISSGFSGRVTDTCLVESCDFLKCLQPGMCVMADRGFKHVEQYFCKQGVQLVRAPSVTTGTNLSNREAKETKKIASLRIHVESVIRRLREFNMLKPHVFLNLNLAKVLDDVITIACGLINLQDSLIK